MSLRLEYDARKNPGIWLQLLALTPRQLIALGQPVLSEQQRLVQEAVAQAFEVQLGGPAGQRHGWGRCLAVRVGDQLVALRSQLGNALAEESARRGLRALAAVAYVEVRTGHLGTGCVTRPLQGDANLQSTRLVTVSGSKRVSTPCDHPPSQAAMCDPSKIKVSLRSIGENEDTTPISQVYGGGGHHNASSFICNTAEFEAWRTA
jgi:hypothetical protein